MEKIIDVNSLTKDFEVNTEYENLFRRLLNKNKKCVRAVNDVSLRVEKGEIIALLGKNGAGKTTLIKMLSGILMPTSGNITSAGMIPYKNRYKYSYKIGVVLGQKSLLWHNIPAKDSLNLYKSIYEISDQEYKERLNFFINLFDVSELLNTPVRKLSLGERMKFELIAALLHKPEILFLDEPTIGLDVISKQQIYHFIKKVNEETNTTIIITTHNIDDVENLCNRVILMDKGKIIFDGNKDELCCLNEKKKIVIKGKVCLDEKIASYLEKSYDNQYNFECEPGDKEAVASIIERTEPGSDISILGTDIEEILIKVYEGEIKF